MKERYSSLSVALKDELRCARRITICLDGWSKKNLVASYLGISACYFDPKSNRPKHAFLSLCSIPHPHTGEVLADCLNECLLKWGITEAQVILIVTDNGSNMLKAVKVMKARYIEAHEVESSADDYGETSDEDDASEFSSGDEENEELSFPHHVSFRRMQCMAHTLQLVVKPAYCHYNTLLTKTRHLVGRIRKSSVAVDKLVSRCGKCVIADCTTRWNSTHQMIQRLLSIKSTVNEVLTEIGN